MSVLGRQSVEEGGYASSGEFDQEGSSHNTAEESETSVSIIQVAEPGAAAREARISDSDMTRRDLRPLYSDQEQVEGETPTYHG